MEWGYLADDQIMLNKKFSEIMDSSNNIMDLLDKLPSFINSFDELTFVGVESPNKVLGKSLFKKIRKFRDGGGVNKVVVLAFNIPTNFGQLLYEFNDDKLEVLQINPQLLSHLKMHETDKQLKRKGAVNFFTLGYLKIDDVSIKSYDDNTDLLTVKFNDYIIFSPDKMQIKQKDYEKLEWALNEARLNLIDYISIDPDYDGEVFENKWQKFRTKDKMIITEPATVRVPHKDGGRVVCVRAVDVFSNELETVVEL